MSTKSKSVFSFSSFSLFKDVVNYCHEHIMYLNNSKFFAGIVMILLNIGSKFVSVQFSKSTEEYLKLSLSKQLLVFSMAWMGTRDIYTSLGLTAIFVVLSEHFFNEESDYCMIPHHLRLSYGQNENDKKGEANTTDTVTNEELNSAIAILEKAKREKLRQSSSISQQPFMK